MSYRKKKNAILIGRKVLILIAIVSLSMMVIVFFAYGSFSSLNTDALYTKHISMSKEVRNCMDSEKKLSYEFWRKVDYHKLNISEALKHKASTIDVISDTVNVTGAVIHFRTGIPEGKNKISVLLLHGQSFDSKTWEDLFTIQLCTAFGFRTVAIDLPGFGKSSKLKQSSRKDFLYNVLISLNMVKPVIVSPSMSGVFSLPYIIEHWYNTSGFVPVSPVATSLLEKVHCFNNSNHFEKDQTCQSWMNYLKLGSVPDLSCLMVPVMIVCGQHDSVVSSAQLCHLPLSKGEEIPGGKHAAYISNPELWHKLLYNFLLMVSHFEKCKEPSR